MTKLIIDIKDLSPLWLEEMKQRYKNAQVEIIVHEAELVQNMTEEQFWRIIDLLDWSKGEAGNDIIKPAIEKLKEFSVGDIYRFQDILAEKLYALDRQVFAEQIGEFSYAGSRHFSVDTFLYARACVVANGKEFYGKVLGDPGKMPKDFTFEPLLYLAERAFVQKTGEDWDYLPKVSFETFSNREGWSGKSWLDKL